MACWCYEGILLFGVLFIASYLFSSLSQTRHALDNRVPQMAFLFLVLGIYFVWFWARGQTLAMKTWHIRLVDRQGARVSQKQALLRYLLSWLWFVPPLALVWILGLDSRFALVTLLLEAGADMEAAEQGGGTPLALAAQHGQEGCVALLVEAGASCCPVVTGSRRWGVWLPVTESFSLGQGWPAYQPA